MYKTLKISFGLKNTYTVNAILHGLKCVPIIKHAFPPNVYQLRGFKIFAGILSVFKEILSVFSGKILYFIILMLSMGRISEFTGQDELNVFLHVLVFFTIIGALLNTYIFEASRDKYYALILLGMNPREYTLVNFYYSLIKLIIGMLAGTLVIHFMGILPVAEAIMIPFFIVGTKLIFISIRLKIYSKKGVWHIDPKNMTVPMVASLILLVLTIVSGLLKLLIPVIAVKAIMLLAIIGGIPAFFIIVGYNNYRQLCRWILLNSFAGMDKTSITQTVNQQVKKSITADTSITSTKTGFNYLNDLFVKRHRKLLWNASKWISLVCLALVICGALVMLFLPDVKSYVNRFTMSMLPFFVFIMYMLNRGQNITRAIFINCDNSLLTYPFYKQPKFILKLFQIRLIEIVKVNLVPAGVIGGGLALWLFVSGGTDQWINYLILMTSIPALSVFFSVHYLTIYYLLQPYNAGTEIKSFTYTFVMGATYGLSYMFLRLKLPTLVFGASTIVFCLLYSALACVLVYKLAYKTFKIRA